MGRSELIVGIFVGGASSRMGSPKGLLFSPDEPRLSLVERLIKEVNQTLPHATCVLVGKRSEYATLSLPMLADVVPERGPLGGLVALLDEGARLGTEYALAVACDHPYLKGALLARLADESPQAAIYCPLREGKFEPLVARYRVDLRQDLREALMSGKLALQPLLKEFGAHSIPLNSEEERTLIDWDTPDDIAIVAGQA